MFNLSKEEITFKIVEDFCKEWKEGVRVEYKAQFPKDIPKILSSFANTQGGVLIIGIEADKIHNKVNLPIKGIPKVDGIEERIVQSGLMGIHPPVMPEVIILDVPETENVVIVVRVDESHHAPHAIQNSTKVYIRFESISQPYEKPELAKFNRIEYLLNRRQNESGVNEQILNQMESWAKQFCSTDATILTLVARPVFPYRPVISPGEIYELYKADKWIRRVPGGILYVLPAGTEMYAVNEHGIVYHHTLIHDYEQSGIQILDFIRGIYYFMDAAKKLYNNCDYLGNIEVNAKVHNVKDKKLSKKIGNLRANHLHSELVCSVDEFYITASRYYLSRDFSKPEHQKSIAEELILQVLWNFDVPTESDSVIKEVRKIIDPTDS